MPESVALPNASSISNSWNGEERVDHDAFRYLHKFCHQCLHYISILKVLGSFCRRSGKIFIALRYTNLHLFHAFPEELTFMEF